MNETLANIFESSRAIYPEVFIIFGILLFTTWAAFSPRPSTEEHYKKTHLGLIVVLCLATVLTWLRYSDINEPLGLFAATLLIDKTTALFQVVILVASVISLLHGQFLKFKSVPEFSILFLGVVLGSMILAASHHFLVLLVSIELISLSSYVLVAIQKKGIGFEASIKYLTVGATVTAIMLYGISLVYGLSGQLSLEAISIISNTDGAVTIVLLLTLGGILFKLSAAPFHVWAPDVYEAAPLPVLSFLSVVPKVAAFVILFKIVSFTNGLLDTPLAVIILTTISIGNFAALRQKDAKRMMAYSGIAQVGFLLIGLLALPFGGDKASFFYLITYSVMNVSAFLLIDLLRSHTHSTLLNSFSGLGSKHFLLGLLGIIVMVSLVGIPPTGGFTAKFLVFTSLLKPIESGNNLLLIVLIFGVINTAVALFYYLRIPYFMFVKETAEDQDESTHNSWAAMTLLGCVVLLLIWIFLDPSLLLNLLP